MSLGANEARGRIGRRSRSLLSVDNDRHPTCAKPFDLPACLRGLSNIERISPQVDGVSPRYAGIVDKRLQVDDLVEGKGSQFLQVCQR